MARWDAWLNAPEMELWPLGYAHRCRGKACRTWAFVIARAVDNQGRYEKQAELCGLHLRIVENQAVGDGSAHIA